MDDSMTWSEIVSLAILIACAIWGYWRVRACAREFLDLEGDDRD